MADIFSLDAYDFDLPADLIATHPVSPRDAARLLVSDGHVDAIFRDLVRYMNAGDVLVVNQSRVIPARLFGVRPKRDAVSPDVTVEILLHRPRGDFSKWTAFAKPAKRLRDGDKIMIADDFVAHVTGRDDDQILLEFPYGTSVVEKMLDKYGHVPLPPYMNRADETADKTEYQTVYARDTGSIAAPTAGLHFTDTLLDALRAKGVVIAPVTLHVGAGTFTAVTANDIRQHKMHAEWGQVTAETATIIAAARAKGHAVTAVGTTSLRLVETAARQTGVIMPWAGDTDIFITPGFDFRVADRLVTNFHIPKSTLFMLISAFLGSINAAQSLYKTAIDRRYRFYSYGDACLLTRGGGRGKI